MARQLAAHPHGAHPAPRRASTRAEAGVGRRSGAALRNRSRGRSARAGRLRLRPQASPRDRFDSVVPVADAAPPPSSRPPRGPRPAAHPTPQHPDVRHSNIRHRQRHGLVPRGPRDARSRSRCASCHAPTLIAAAAATSRAPAFTVNPPAQRHRARRLRASPRSGRRLGRSTHVRRQPAGVSDDYYVTILIAGRGTSGRSGVLARGLIDAPGSRRDQAALMSYEIFGDSSAMSASSSTCANRSPCSTRTGLRGWTSTSPPRAC
jgi:hypothetical protein